MDMRKQCTSMHGLSAARQRTDVQEGRPLQWTEAGKTIVLAGVDTLVLGKQRGLGRRPRQQSSGIHSTRWWRGAWDDGAAYNGGGERWVHPSTALTADVQVGGRPIRSNRRRVERVAGSGKAQQCSG
ncbi:hypothetical protein E2562_037407 [Oryza meyeriana var. granulata]|uniref:Uncharacterized protein n=1 Tax=Oryza meyeriana var. granulata TaxID=110450 RepID=A0A6G1EEY4_9ORYZ|nr:hypothetical protein E2562_037407 [Oryza meyeriana var. granulata]